MGAGLLAVQSGFILFIKIYQFLHNEHAFEKGERERERESNTLEHYSGTRSQRGM
jgi:hypothetical protein